VRDGSTIILVDPEDEVVIFSQQAGIFPSIDGPSYQKASIFFIVALPMEVNRLG
jgi:uncharacterized protein YllA (UPF0747 family)